MDYEINGNEFKSQSCFSHHVKNPHWSITLIYFHQLYNDIGDISCHQVPGTLDPPTCSHSHMALLLELLAALVPFLALSIYSICYTISNMHMNIKYIVELCVLYVIYTYIYNTNIYIHIIQYTVYIYVRYMNRKFVQKSQRVFPICSALSSVPLRQPLHVTGMQIASRRL